MKSVLVVGGDHLVMKMFNSQGWHSHPHPKMDLWVDLVCFTGGADVSPYLYGEENVSSHCDPMRDEYEREIYDHFVGKVPLVGICRGGQFLHVMNGGKMIQDVGRYVSSKLPVWFPAPKKAIPLHVDHHQGIPFADDDGVVAYQGLGDDNREPYVTYIRWIEKTRALLFQPHPEWGHAQTKDIFFQCIEDFIFPAPIDALVGEMGKVMP